MRADRLIKNPRATFRTRDASSNLYGLSALPERRRFGFRGSRFYLVASV
jgi:hypothetical protein